jgi:hypothetical protein
MRVRLGSAMVRFGVFLVVSCAVLASGCPCASAAAPAPAWSISSVAEPTNFNSADAQGETTNDRYTVVVTNIGSVPTSGVVTVTDTLPALLAQEQLLRTTYLTERPSRATSRECVLTPPVTITCEYNEPEHPVQPGDKLTVSVYVAVPAGLPSGVLVNEAGVSGGGGGEASVSESTPVNAGPASFGVDQFSFESDGLAGEQFAQAGGHPYAVTTNTTLNTVFTGGFNPGHFEQAAIVPQEAKSIGVELPLGLAGDPLAAERCPEVKLTEQIGGGESGRTECPAGSIVGAVWLTTGGVPWNHGPFPLYNVVPEHGYPAELGFSFGGVGQPIFLYVTVVPSASGYQLRVTSPAALRAVNVDVEQVAVTIFGDPGAHSGVPGDAAFVRNPTACSGEPVAARLDVRSWEGSSDSRETTAYPQVAGCDLLQGVSVFNPSLRLEPEVSQADSPSGYAVDVKIPQAPNVFGGLATPDMRDAVVTLPAGVAISPAVASGPAALEGCTEAQIDLLGTELGAGHVGGDGSPYDDGLVHASPGHCPEGSQVATVEAFTPILPEPLQGHMYVAAPQCGGEGQAPCTEAAVEEGRVFGVYVEVAGSGVIFKQAGSLEVGGYGARNGLAVGQLRARFQDIAQQPLEELKVTFAGGQRTVLANPQTCGAATATGDLRPWSAPQSGPDALPSWQFMVTGCGAGIGFAPGFSAGTVGTLAGRFSPFALNVTRRDGEQDLAGVSVTLPPGVAGILANVARCPEPQAQTGACPAASRVGTATVAAGAGAQPLSLSGPVYLTGPYRGAPFGLSVVVPAKAGPYDFGDVVVRSAIGVDPHTAQVMVSSDPLPQAVDGVPVRLKTVSVSVDREGFIFNPTNCSQLHVTGTIAADMPDGSPGASAGVSSPFAVAGCVGLPFKPSFKVATQARTSKQNGASLDVKITSGQGQANIGKVAVTLPKQLPSRLTTIQQACTERAFAANPASCPAGSNIGTATARTPVLASPVSGPVYLVSHGGAAFPDVVMILQGEGVTLDLLGNVDIRHGVTSSTFATVPDAPIGVFQMTLPEGPHSALTTALRAKAKGNLCGTSLVMPTTITGQNGAQITQSTKIAVTGCPKATAKKKAKAKRKTKPKHPRKGGKKRK